MIDSHSLTAKLMRLPLRLLKPGIVLPILSGGLRGKKWIVDTGKHSEWLGTYQQGKQILFSEKILPGKVVVDIGGGRGYFTLLASSLVGPEGKVFVFEFLPHHLDSLRNHLALNKAYNVTMIEAAVSYKNVSDSSEHDSSNGYSHFKTCTLDSLLDHGQISVPDLIHINISGGEFAALCGARTLLSKTHPTVILTTYEDESYQKCCAFLEMLEYRLESVDAKLLDDSRLIVASHI